MAYATGRGVGIILLRNVGNPGDIGGYKNIIIIILSKQGKFLLLSIDPPLPPRLSLPCCLKAQLLGIPFPPSETMNEKKLGKSEWKLKFTCSLEF